MKCRTFILLAGLGLFGLSLATDCRGETAKEMLSACRPVADAKVSNGMVTLPIGFESGVCWGAFSVAQGLLNTSDPGQPPALHVCLPATSTRSQLIGVYVKYVDAHPEKDEDEFVTVLLGATLDAFPCAAKSSAGHS